MLSRLVFAGTILAIAAFAQDGAPESKPAPKSYLVEPGTHIPLSLINSVSTKNSVPGDRVYLETVFPILVDGRIVIPPGSYVMGTITEVQRPGRMKGRGEFHLRFDSLTLPNGTTRDFRARVSGLDGRATRSWIARKAPSRVKATSPAIRAPSRKPPRPARAWERSPAAPPERPGWARASAPPPGPPPV